MIRETYPAAPWVAVLLAMLLLLLGGRPGLFAVMIVASSVFW